MPDTLLTDAYTALSRARAVVATTLCSPSVERDAMALAEAKAAARLASRLLNRAAWPGNRGRN